MRRSTNTWIVGALGASLALMTACASDPAAGKPATTASPPTTSPTPTPAGPAWEKEGATFSGPQAGGRGGSYSYTLCPGGSYVRFCLDSDCDRGTWRRDGETIVLLSENPDTKGQETRLALSADGKSLGPPDIEGGPLTLSGPPEKCG